MVHGESSADDTATDEQNRDENRHKEHNSETIPAGESLAGGQLGRVEFAEPPFHSHPLYRNGLHLMLLELVQSATCFKPTGQEVEHPSDDKQIYNKLTGPNE